MNYEHNIRLLRDLFDDGRFANDYYRAIIPSGDFLVLYDEFTKFPFIHKKSSRRYSEYERAVDSHDKRYGICDEQKIDTTGFKTLVDDWYLASQRIHCRHTDCIWKKYNIINF